MNMDDFKEVRFDKYCKTCKHEKKKDFEDPCNECLTYFMRKGTEKPEFWKEK